MKKETLYPFTVIGAGAVAGFWLLDDLYRFLAFAGLMLLLPPGLVVYGWIHRKEKSGQVIFGFGLFLSLGYLAAFALAANESAMNELGLLGTECSDKVSVSAYSWREGNIEFHARVYIPVKAGVKASPPETSLFTDARGNWLLLQKDVFTPYGSVHWKGSLKDYDSSRNVELRWKPKGAWFERRRECSLEKRLTGCK